MVNATIKDGEHHTIVQGGKDAQKRRKIEENQDIALVGLKRMVEHKKADKLQNNLHLIDFPKANQHIFFVSDPSEIAPNKKHLKILDEPIQIEDDEEEE